MRRFLLLPLLLLTSPVWAGDYSLTLSGDTSAACTISFSTEAESVDGVHPLEDGDITAFACTISAASLTLVLGDLQYPLGLDYVVSGGKVTAVELQTNTSNELQIGTATEDTVGNRWYLFGHGTVFAGAGNVAVIAAVADGSFAGQAATMAPGEWKQLVTTNGFQDVAISCDDSAAITTAQGGLVSICGWGTASRVLEAWNSAVYDPAENRMLFFGGGHASYGGNEVYEFDFDTLTWTRLTDPEALNVAFDGGGDSNTYAPRDVSPADGISDTPGAPHTYDAEAWNSTTGEFVMLPHHTIYPSTGSPMANTRFYTFDPDTQTWTPRVSTGVTAFTFGRCEYIPADNETICEDGTGTSSHELYTIADDGTFTDCGLLSGMNSKLAQIITDASDGSVYDVGNNSIRKLTPNGCSTTSAPVVATEQPSGLSYSLEMAYAGIGTGINDIWYIWGGNEEIVTFDPATQTFDLIANASYASTGPYTDFGNRGGGKVLGKWRCFPTEGVCAGIAEDRDDQTRDGWWLYRPPAVDTAQAELGTLALDGSTQSTLSIHLPLLDDSDDNNDATAYIEYRETAVGGAYTRGVDMFHQRPELVDTGDGYPYNPDGLDAMIWGLTPDTEYDIKVTAADPDGHTGMAVQTLSAVSTKALPISDYTGFGTTEASTLSALNSALASACDGSGTGHIVQIPADTTIDASSPTDPRVVFANPTSPDDCGANEGNPIILRGENRDTSVIDCTGFNDESFNACINIKSSFVIVENLTILGDTDYGIWIYNERTGGCKVHNVAVRDIVINRVGDGVGVNHGIATGFCDAYDIYVADNELHGPYTFPDFTTAGGEKGIKISGHDAEVEHNTIEGFVDGTVVDFINNTPVGDPDEEENHSIAFHHNLVLYSTDDAFELDEAHRNVVVHHNAASNSGDCLSFQPVRGGPAYAANNICYSMRVGPIKFKPSDADPTGMIVVNNTFLKNDSCWNNGNSGTDLHQVDVRNNLFFCEGTTPSVYTLNAYGNYDPDTAVVDYNAWNTNHRFEVSDGATEQFATSFSAWIVAGIYGTHDVLTEGETVFKTLTPDFDDTAGGDLWGDRYRDLLGQKFDLDSGSSAANGGVVIPGITPAGDDHPAIGACEADECDATGTFYGVR